MAVSSSFILFTGFYHVFVEAGTISSFDCSIERLFLSHCSGLTDSLQSTQYIVC